MFDNVKCFIMSNESCNDFVDADFSSDEGIILSLEETVEYQKEHNAPILVYETTDKALVEYFTNIGGKVC